MCRVLSSVMSVTARPVVYTGDIFRQQERGGITRVFVEIARRLSRPVFVVAGLHRSFDLSELKGRVRWAGPRPRFRGDRVLLAPLDRLVDALALPRRGAILHPTYYRAPRSLPPGTPWVVTVHDMTHERFPELFPHRWWSHDPARHKAALCARAARIVCYSESARRDVIERLPVAEARVRVIPLAGREWNGIPSAAIPGVQNPFALWVGERHTYKNWERTLEALATSPAGRDLGVLCVGGGGFAPGERAHLERLGLSDRVIQRAAGDAELKWAYERASALLYTSLWEGFGLPVLEALALGCPVLCSDRASLPIVGGDAAVYADPTDLDALRHGIAVVLADDRSPNRVAARRAQAARFSWDATAEAYERLYQELDP